jgi:hypothetical protein
MTIVLVPPSVTYGLGTGLNIGGLWSSLGSPLLRRLARLSPARLILSYFPPHTPSVISDIVYRRALPRASV